MYSMIVLGVLLDVACWKYRKLATCLFLFECVIVILNGFAPINYGYYGPFVTLVSLFVLVTMLACHFPGPNIVFVTLFYFMIEFVQQPMVTESPNYSYQKFICMLTLFVLSSLVWMLIRWVLRLQTRFKVVQKG